MVDVAQLGLAVDSSQVDKGTVALTRMTGAASAAERAAKGLAGADRQASGAAAQVASSANAAAAALDRQAGAAMRASRAANDNVARMGGSFSGLAAQFQDIGVTAAMGMNPMIIALQQGTQIAGQMEVAMQNGGSAASVFGTALRSLINPVSLVVIGLVALVAAGLQMVDWAKLAQSALRFVADNLQTIAPYATAAAVGIALLYAPALLGGLSSLGAALYGIERAMLAVLATIGWPALLVAGIVALGGAAIAFRDDITRILGVDIVGAAKAGANYLIASFVLAYERVKTIWLQLPNIIKAALTAAKNLVTGGTENTAADAVAAAFGTIDTAGIVNRDYVGEIGAGISSAASAASSKLKEWANGLDTVDKKAQKAAQKAKEAYADILRGGQQFIAAQELERNAIGMTGQAANRLRYEQELLNKAANDNIKLTPQQTAELKALAASMAEAEAQTTTLKRAFDFAKDLTKGFVSDLRNGLQQGEGFWRSFGNAALNVLDRIIDKLLNQMIDALFQVGSMAGGGGGGFFGSLLGGIGKLFGFQNGGVFTRGEIVPFAAGGVVTRPTTFSMGRGRTGLMGEAGPEAIMPLRRGVGGRLGVEANGSQVIEANINLQVAPNEMFDVRVREVSGPVAVAVVRQNNKTISGQIAQDQKRFG